MSSDMICKKTNKQTNKQKTETEKKQTNKQTTENKQTYNHNANSMFLNCSPHCTTPGVVIRFYEPVTFGEQQVSIYADIGNLKSFNTLFDKLLDHMLVKFKQNRMVQVSVDRFI